MGIRSTKQKQTKNVGGIESTCMEKVEKQGTVLGRLTDMSTTSRAEMCSRVALLFLLLTVKVALLFCILVLTGALFLLKDFR